MNMHRFFLVASLGFAPAAWAQDTTDEEPVPDTGSSVPETVDPSNKPEPPSVNLPDLTRDTKALAGVGSGVAYATQGTGEVGGSLALALANDSAVFSADPMIGYFFWDNVELSAILGYRYLNVEDDSSNLFSFMLEPSVHVPFNNGVFGVAGLGLGVGLGDNVDANPDVDAGFQLAPRLGVQLLIGRSGLLNLNARYSIIFSGLDANVADPLEGSAVVAFGNVFDVGAGYTVMF